MNDQLVTLDDESLDQVAGGVTVGVSISFPTPRELLSAYRDAVRGVASAVVSGFASVLSLFGVDINVAR
jgi:hypothetical protein